ncbi:hypothetical protein [Ruminococcus sp.]|uniref:hypothetical protein n=1 Tax=Ruminococcus sp. TaxID=41978 RepID=UPI0025CCC3AD|nr:hypothetical protein [Ruminococcus sp.]MBO4524640.1 hypothetical protein [Ruminococcus sp.]
MKVRELIRFSNKLLNGRRTGSMMICILPIGAELFFRFAEAAVYSLLLYFGNLQPIKLFGGDEPLQFAVTTVCTVLRCVTVAPLTYAASYLLYGITGERPCRIGCSFSRILLRKCTLKRSISAALWTKAISLFALTPAIFFGVSAYSMIHEKMYAEEAFIATNMIILAAVSVFMWLSLKMSFFAIPYLLVRFPKLTAFRAMVFSVRFMSGRKSVFLKLLAVYLPQMLTIVGFPYGLTKLMTAFSLSIDIFIKEDEYLEADRAESGRRKAHDTRKISHRTKRRVKTAADKA